MLLYDDLTPAQKKWVDLLDLFFPDMPDVIDNKQIKQVHEFLYAKRAEDPRFKTGYPVWLENNNRVGPKAFFVPRDGRMPAIEERVNPLDIEYENELKRFGVCR